MNIRVFELAPVATNAYLLSDEETKQAIVIDVPMGAWDVIAPIVKAEQLALQAVLLTHAHFDHVLGAQAFKDAGVPFYLHSQERETLGRLGEQLKYFNLPADMQSLEIEHWLEDNASLEFLGHSIECRRVSGHSPGNVVFYFAAEACAFVGDAIFKGSIGRYDLPGGSFKVLKHDIIEQIYSLPNETVLYPGHGPATELGYERINNPFVKG